MSSGTENGGHEIYKITVPELISSSRFKAKLIFSLMVLLALSMVANFVQFNYLPEPVVVAETPDGKFRPIPTMDQPVHSDDSVLSWAEKAAVQLYDMPFTEISVYPSRLSFMVPEAKRQFIEAIQKAGFVEKVRTERRIMRAYVTDRATLLDKQLGKRGRYLWMVEVPIGVVFEGAENSPKTFYVLQMLIGREHIALTSDESGIVLAKVDIKPGRAPSRR